MYRNQEEAIGVWFESKRRKPLLIRGARQVGKSTLVKLFCESRKLRLHEINLELHTHLNSVFKSKDANKMKNALEDILETKINPKNSILFFDELQETPFLIPALRYFYEKMPELAIIGAGSLLEFTLNDHEYSMPVGRLEFLHMGPMVFSEFLLAHQENYLVEELFKLSPRREISDVLHDKMLSYWKQYLFVGGMPEAVLASVADSEAAVSRVHAQILQTYQADFVKYASKKHLEKIQKIFRATLLQPCQKIKYSSLLPKELSRDIKKNLDLLTQAKVVTKIFHTNCSGIPLELGVSDEIFKLVSLDVGLVNHGMGLRKKEILLFQEENLLSNGVMAEQFIGQHLISMHDFFMEPKLFYWLREGKMNNAEVDYILQSKNDLVALEVKSGASGKIRSLHQWFKTVAYKKKKAFRFNLSKGINETIESKIGAETVRFQLQTLPVYAVEALKNYM